MIAIRDSLFRLHAARKERADLKLMSTRGHDHSADGVLGSNTERVVRPAPVRCWLPDRDAMKAGDPFARFRELLQRAQSFEGKDARSVCLATADGEGRPSARMLVLEALDGCSFIFLSHYGSRKAGELERNPWAALCFHWPTLAVQVRVEGLVEKVTAAESDAYFASRPRGHQIAAYASRQSTPLESRRELLVRFREAEVRFGDQAIPRPRDWGGYRLWPERIEFWHGFEHRLHDRLLFTRGPGGWTSERLSP